MAVIINYPGPSTLSGGNEFNYFFWQSLSEDFVPNDPITSYDRNFSSGVFDNDTLTGGSQIDIFRVTLGKDVLSGGDGVDVLELGDRLPEVVEYSFEFYRDKNQTPRPLDVVATSSYIDVASGNYSFKAEVGRQGGTDDPYEVKGSGSFSSIERIFSGMSNDVIFGSDGGNFVIDRYYESFNPGGGDDKIDGRGGFDILSYETDVSSVGRTTGIIVDFATSTVKDGLGGTDTFSGIELVEGSSFADTFNGGPGDDWMTGGAGADSYVGGAGFDRVEFEYGSGIGVTVDLGAGTGTSEYGDKIRFSGIEAIIGTAYSDTLVGGDGDDTFDGFLGDDKLSGGIGNDTLSGGRGDDELNGGADNDRLTGGDGADSIDGGTGFDTLDYGAEFKLGGSFYPDRLIGTMGVNVTLKNNKALDTYGETDSVFGIEQVIGTDLFDIISGDNGKNVIFGAGGRDNLGGLGGKDKLFGGDGVDRLGGGSGKDDLRGGAGNDNLFGGKGRDDLDGGSGDDGLFGEADADILNGGFGDDKLTDDKSEASTIKLYNSALKVLEMGGQLSSIKDARMNSLNGGTGDDVLRGNGILNGDSGSDVLRGGGLLFGGKGNDTLVADPKFDSNGPGLAMMVGGFGRDTISSATEGTDSAVSYGYSASKLDLDLLSGVARAGRGDVDQLSNIDEVHGTAFNDIMRDGAGKNGLSGHGGDDRIVVGRADDAIDYAFGGAGFDMLTGVGEGTVNLYGEGDNDVIIIRSRISVADGGQGKDTIKIERGGRNFDEGASHELSGGSDNDTFIINTRDNLIVQGGSGNDTIVLNTRGSLDGIGFASIQIFGGIGKDTLDINGDYMIINFMDANPNKDRFLIASVLPDNIKNFAQLRADAVDQGSDVVIGLETGQLRLSGLNASDLTSSMFDL